MKNLPSVKTRGRARARARVPYKRGRSGGREWWAFGGAEGVVPSLDRRAILLVHFGRTSDPAAGLGRREGAARGRTSSALLLLLHPLHVLRVHARLGVHGAHPPQRR